MASGVLDSTASDSAVAVDCPKNLMAEVVVGAVLARRRRVSAAMPEVVRR